MVATQQSKRAGVGRPPKPPARKLDRRVTVCFDEEGYQTIVALREQLRQEGKELAAFARDTLVPAARARLARAS